MRAFKQLATALNKPEYFFRPTQLARRFKSAWPERPGETALQLPWRLHLRISANDTIGRAIWHLGVYDLPLTEALWRLIEPGELVVDVGANLGYVSSLMARKVGPGGTLLCFEPHPDLFAELQANIGHWKSELGSAFPTLRSFAAALSDSHQSTANLVVPADFASNAGLSYLGRPKSSTDRSIPVKVCRLDEVIDAYTNVGVLKIDTEGHEESVLKGCIGMLVTHRIRDIVFEDHQAPPTPCMRLLWDAGYSVFRIGKTFWGPRITDPMAKGPAASSWEAQSYLATSARERALIRFQHRGWDVLRM
jgi:FkbM family methyltransferase